MTVKQFFASKTFRCIVVLLCIALVAGALLSILNDVLYVSAEERVARTIKTIYGKEMEYTTIYDAAGEADNNAQTIKDAYALPDVPTESDTGRIDNVYFLNAEGNLLIKATGKQGYKQGTVSVWCVATYENGQFVEITNVSIAEYDKQTLMSKFTKSVMEGYHGSDAFNHVETGATFSSNALNNALNEVLTYVGKGGAA